MHRIASAAIAAVLAGTMALPAPAAAQSASFNLSFGQQDRFVSQRCRAHPHWRGCDDWRRNHHRWGQNDYRNWYRWNRPNVGNFAAGLFGFALGAAVGRGFDRDDRDWRGGRAWEAHVARCEARYRSYDPRTDSFLGYDGDYHRCTL